MMESDTSRSHTESSEIQINRSLAEVKTLISDVEALRTAADVGKTLASIPPDQRTLLRLRLVSAKEEMSDILASLAEEKADVENTVRRLKSHDSASGAYARARSL